MVRRAAAESRLALVPPEYRITKVHESKCPPGRRFCAGCQTFVLLEDCAGSRCKACAAIGSHKSRTKAVYGIDGATWQWLMDRQGGRCAICRQRPLKSNLAVDHRHGHEACGGKGCPGCVRGLLCTNTPSCNHELLGAAHDSIEILQRAIDYLRCPPMSEYWQPPAAEVEAWRAQYGTDDPAPF